MPNTTPPPGLRLNKALAQAGISSRRGADAIIKAGRVSINAETVTEPGTRIDPSFDDVRVDGKPLPAAQQNRTILLHKPPQVVTTASDPEGRTTVFDLLPPNLRSLRLFHVGRLDYFSEGLILLTTDGELCNALTHPSRETEKVYHVTTRPPPSQEQLKTMRQGMVLAEGEKLAPVKARVVAREADTATVEMVLHQGVNRQIRRMCRDLDLVILRLVRVAEGPVRLGELPRGQWRELHGAELDRLRKSAGRRG
jgi:23S rRNA pseudouridine2605 synthase